MAVDKAWLTLVVVFCWICLSSGLLFGKARKRQVEEPFYTCKQLSSRLPIVYSGINHISLPSGFYEVYCEMGINGGGYTFIPEKLLAKMTTEDLKYLFTNNADVLLRISKPDGSQPYTVIRQLKNTGGLRLYLNGTARLQSSNSFMGPHLLLDTMSNQIQDKQTAGVISNSKPITFENCGLNNRGYFAFFINSHEKKPSTSQPHLIYEHQGIAVDWRKSAIRPYSGRRMPFNYFLFTEVHFGGCGTYTSSDRWLTAKYPALGTAIGVR